MFLATGSSFDFMQFLQILCWILVPALLLAVMATIFFHYRKRQAARKEEESGEALVMGSPEIVGYTKGDGEYICFDHSPLISEYKNRLTFTHARFAALRHDFEKLEIRYAALADYTAARFKAKNLPDMESLNEQLPRPIKKEVDKILAQYRSEKDELHANLAQLNQSFKSLEEENQLLQDQLNLTTVSGEEKEAIYTRLGEENRLLKEKVSEQQYLHDMLEEKNTQLVFLQGQLEQRVILHHQADQQRIKLESEILLLKNQSIAEKGTIEENFKNELLQKHEETERIQAMVHERESQIAALQREAAAKQEQLAGIESILNETRESNGELAVLLRASNEKIAVLQEQLNNERERSQSAQHYSIPGTEQAAGIYNEYAGSGDGTEQSPVIPLRPVLADGTNGEIAVH